MSHVTVATFKTKLEWGSRVKIVFIMLVSFLPLCAFASPKSGLGARGHCRDAKQFDEGAFQCSAEVEVNKDFDKNYAHGVVESKVWKTLFDYCDMVGKRLSDSSLIPVPIAQSKKLSSRAKDHKKIIYEISIAFYCGGLGNSGQSHVMPSAKRVGDM